MNLAVILGVCWLSLGSPQNAPPSQPQPSTSQASPQQASQQQASPQQTSPQQSPEPAQAAPPPIVQAPNPTDQVKPSATSPAKRRRPKKTIPNCSNTPASSPDPAKPADANSTNTTSTALPPCAPPKKVVRNGGSAEPSIQLVGGAPDEKSVHQRSTDQLTAATEENLKKIAGRQLNPNQQELVSQIKQFMDESKTAVAAGDLERGHNLALKAHLLSDELVKP
jgi:hypothetical protein